MAWTYPSADVADRPRLVRGAVALSGLLAGGLSLLFGLIVLPALATLFSGLSELVLFGLLLLTSSLVRIAAGLFGARLYRRRHGTDSRVEALPSVLLGVALAWAGYSLLVGLAALLTGADVEVGRVLLELPRWLVEGAAGAALVAPGDREQLDPLLRRFALPHRDAR